MTVETGAPKVATAVTTVRVRKGEEGTFAGWLTELNKAVATFPGYISAVVIPPAPPAQQDWVMVQRFQSLEQLGAWLDSDARRALLDKSTSLLVDEGTTNVIEGTSTEPSPQDMVTEIITRPAPLDCLGLRSLPSAATRSISLTSPIIQSGGCLLPSRGLKTAAPMIPRSALTTGCKTRRAEETQCSSAS